MRSLYGGNVLRIDGTDGSFGTLPGRVLLRRGQLCVYSCQERVWVVSSCVQGELLWGHVHGSEERDGERHLSSGSLLSCGQRGSCVVSPRHELVVSGSDVKEPMSSLCEGLLLSEQRHGGGDTSVLGGVLLSVGNGEPQCDIELELVIAIDDVSVVSRGVVLSSGQCYSHRLCGGVLSGPSG